MSDYRIALDSRECTHVQGRSNPSTSTPDGSPSAHHAAIAVERSDPNEGGELPAVQDHDLGHVRQECQREHAADSRNPAKRVIPLPPDGTVLQRFPKLVVLFLQAALKKPLCEFGYLASSYRERCGVGSSPLSSSLRAAPGGSTAQSTPELRHQAVCVQGA